MQVSLNGFTGSDHSPKVCERGYKDVSSNFEGGPSQARRGASAWLTGIVVIFGLPIVTGILQFVDLAWLGILAALVLALLGWKRPEFRIRGLAGKGLMVSAIIALLLSASTKNGIREQERTGKARAVLEQMKNSPVEGQRALATTDSDTLAAIETLSPNVAKDENLRRAEAQVTKDRQQAAIEGEKKRQEWAMLERQNAPMIAKLKTELAAADRDDIDTRSVVLEQLIKLAPNNAEINRLVSETRTAKSDWERQFSDPASFLKIDKFDWWKGGFDNVMIASFTIRNSAKVKMRDIHLACTVSGESGTVIDAIPKTIYVTVPPRGSKRVSELNLGLINTQVSRANCAIIGAVAG